MCEEVFYIDESGHTGDLLTSGRRFEFNGQPHFVLGAVGPIAPEVAAELLCEVVAKHRLHNMREIKSESLDKRPWVARDLVAALKERGVPLFVEAVDKLFFLALQIVNCQILPPSGVVELNEQDKVVRNQIADYLYDNLPGSVLESFINACREDTPAAVRNSLEILLAWTKVPNEDVNDRNLLCMIGQSVAETIDDLKIALLDDPAGHRRFLPLPDEGKLHAIYWVLPNYSSLTNMYARINRYKEGRLTGVKLVHDGQTQYDDVLRSAKNAVENFVDNTSYSHLGATYDFSERAELSYGVSAETPGLMIADVIAGHVRRVLREHMSESSIHDDALDAFISIWEADVERGAGLNLVLPTAAVHRLQIRAFRRSCERAKAAFESQRRPQGKR